MVNQSGFKKIEKEKGKGLIDKTTTKKKRKESGIPKHIANRMARRVLFTTGIPTICGMSVFIVSYILITKGIAEIAPTLTLLLSGLFFLLGLIGLSYGILSASWENNKGSFLGIENIRPNIKRMKEAFNTKENT
tara:strand:- start:2995 stop:3396 length:402 start_codon:yes stop_codon:yes gene_type:complete